MAESANTSRGSSFSGIDGGDGSEDTKKIFDIATSRLLTEKSKAETIITKHIDWKCAVETASNPDTIKQLQVEFQKSWKRYKDDQSENPVPEEVRKLWTDWADHENQGAKGLSQEIKYTAYMWNRSISNDLRDIEIEYESCHLSEGVQK
ncbi:hypothetical protein L486_06593 [Kwoniella mangroviensis CBS 10435]|uniref:Uncharacterized protein n=1 Tax=Kwoniella mangroviensis CBS 10435 TaxID=1331196 RepID=A0A1B9IJI6_9TREE|nr:hypothetical protein L486_06593 [Kwoniella mangroviensis CBS 10435]OCF71666.1 hypothetical protein I204_07726 [Kwoniella mangroviensis CBS 8886]